MPRKKTTTGRKATKKAKPKAAAKAKPAAKKTKAKAAPKARAKRAPAKKVAKGAARPEILKKVEAIVGPLGYTASPVELRAYAADASMHLAEPELVVRPTSAQQVSAILKLANKYKIPVTPRAAGTSVCGQPVPIKGGIVLDMQAMNKIKEVHVEDFYVVIEPGVVYAELNAFLKPYKFFFPPAPGSGDAANIGGMVINNASGVNATKYGATRDSLLGCKVVLADGTIIDTGANTLIASAGYQIDRLMVASEGTLGVITEAVLRLTPLAKSKGMGVAEYKSLEDAGNAISAIVASGVKPSFFELMDNVAIKSVNKAMDLGLPDVPAILVWECDGASPDIVYGELEFIRNLAEEHGGKNIRLSTVKKEMDEIYKGRQKLFPAFSRYIDGMACVSLADDMAVPPSFYAKVVEKIEKASKGNDVVITAYGHAGEGLIHTKLLIDTTSHGAWERAHKLNPGNPGDAAGVVPAGASPGDRHKGYTWIEYYINELADTRIAEALTEYMLDRTPPEPWKKPSRGLRKASSPHKTVDEMVKAVL